MEKTYDMEKHTIGRVLPMSHRMMRPVSKETNEIHMPNCPDQNSALEAPVHGPSILIEVAWPRSIEHIVIYPEQLCEGSALETVEYAKDWSAELTYAVLCTGAKLEQGKWVVNLSYDRELEANRVLADDDSSLQWGQTSLTIDEDMSKAEAVFRATDGSVSHGRCTVRRIPLLQGLTLGVAKVLLRPGQAALRNRLLREFGMCAISKESIASVLEVAHIIRHADGGAAHEGNAILLRADLHKLFDSGTIDIGADGTVDLKTLATSSNYGRELSEWNTNLPKNVWLRVQSALRRRAASAEDCES